MWFELKGDSRLGRCATENCGGQPVMRLEADGVGSNYCSGCHWKITQMTQRNDLKDKIADAIGSSFKGQAGWNDVCAEAVLSAIEQSGCTICPNEPTTEQTEAGVGRLFKSVRDIYAAMLSSSPFNTQGDEVSCSRPETVDQSVSPSAPQSDSGGEAR